MPRPRKPTHLHIVEGTFNVTRHRGRKREPVVVDPVGDAPPGVDKTIWDELVGKCFCRSWLKSAQCGAYITGVLDTLDDRGFCLPKEAMAAQTIDVVILYQHDHPERLHLPACGLVVDALKEKFPC
jgi:hypothetical protein